MSFWDLDHPSDAIAIVEEGRPPTTYGELSGLSDAFAQRLKGGRPRRLGVVAGTNSLATLVAYLAGLRSGDVVMPLNPALDPALQLALIRRYQPEWIFHDNAELLRVLAAEAGLHLQDATLALRIDGACADDLAADVAILLSTSGSTGSPRMARLSKRNIESNATAIAQYLELSPSERAITTLPFFYSYGLSVIHSHLAVGASICMTNESVMSPAFWQLMSDAGVTSLAGVPYTYQILKRIDLPRRAPATLRTLTQAGGKLAKDLVRHFSQVASQNEWKFYVMYGQTEASPRISYVPPHMVAEKADSIGIPIPGGALDIDPDSGELIYSGPNVMLGYADSRDDLRKGDEMRGSLRTGDTGFRDSDGFYYITGRLKRFVKMFGNRVNLDELESQLAAFLARDCAIVGKDDLLVAVVTDESCIPDARRWFTDHAKMPGTGLRYHVMQDILRQANGKLDYPAIARVTGF